ncbi:MAG: hypothetical protein CMO81_02895 [Waddliaceae bacterium]|nr:hypothetical protein [Waddliaceae bacterium]
MFDNFFKRSWWTILFLLCSLILYERGMGRLYEQESTLRKQLAKLDYRIQEVLEEQQDLKLQIHSQSTYTWIELTLKKGLGLVSKNEKKVYFKRPNIAARVEQ